MTESTALDEQTYAELEQIAARTARQGEALGTLQAQRVPLAQAASKTAKDNRRAQALLATPASRWAICMVRDGEKPRREEASCCRLEVVKGG